MSRMTDRTGLTYGRLLVLAATEERAGGGAVVWKCRCCCGNIVYVSGCKLRDGNVQSCGCFQDDARKSNNYKHGHASEGITKTYTAWHNMLQRCLNEKASNYENYGARGITVCKRWLKFANFLKDMGVKPKGMVLDRANNDRNYTPRNCQWVTYSQSNKNRRPFSLNRKQT